MSTYEQQLMAIKHAIEIYEAIEKQEGAPSAALAKQWLHDCYDTIAAVKLVESLEPKEKES